MDYRIEKDSMGEMKVPASALYGSQTQRAFENFPISGIRFSRSMIQAFGLVKRCAAEINCEMGLLDPERKNAIIQAALAVEKGELDDQFILDIFQTGSGTSSNMNTNEVIASKTKDFAPADLKIHPNDHVNMSQSSNDVFPTAMHVAAVLMISEKLLPALEYLESALGKKAKEFAPFVKTGRTHLMDATPITLGQEFSGYQAQLTQGIRRIKQAKNALLELPLGGTAVGTGVNTPIGFPQKTIAKIASETGEKFFEAANHFEAQAAKDAIVEMSGQLKTLACSFAKIANDVRWMGSGPRCGLFEIRLPEIQPGSSIMPGKVNPVVAESVMMVAAQVVGNDAAITMAGFSGGILELHVMMPVMIHNLLQSIELLGTTARNFADRCILGIEANPERLKYYAEASLTVCTALAPKIGYDLAAKLSKEAFQTGESLRAVALRHQVLPEDELDRLLDLEKMTRPNVD
jgi:fumarate hydratase, class II